MTYHYKILACRVIDGDSVELVLDLGFHLSLTDEQKLKVFEENREYVERMKMITDADALEKFRKENEDYIRRCAMEEGQKARHAQIAEKELEGKPCDASEDYARRDRMEEDQKGKMTKWETIDTAPRDGTSILGWNEDYGQRETYMEKYQKGSPGFAKWEKGDGPLNYGWRWSEPKSNWACTWRPTHWMPLPPPPFSTKSED